MSQVVGLGAGPIEFQTADLLAVLGRFMIVPLVATVIATFLLSRQRFQGSGRMWKVTGLFVLILVAAMFVWGFLMGNIQGGIFDQSWWRPAGG